MGGIATTLVIANMVKYRNIPVNFSRKFLPRYPAIHKTMN